MEKSIEENRLNLPGAVQRLPTPQTQTQEDITLRVGKEKVIHYGDWWKN